MLIGLMSLLNSQFDLTMNFRQWETPEAEFRLLHQGIALLPVHYISDHSALWNDYNVLQLWEVHYEIHYDPCKINVSEWPAIIKLYETDYKRFYNVWLLL